MLVLQLSLSQVIEGVSFSTLNIYHTVIELDLPWFCRKDYKTQRKQLCLGIPVNLLPQMPEDNPGKVTADVPWVHSHCPSEAWQ